MNEPSTPPLVYESVHEFLRRHPPFSTMSEAALQFMIPRLSLGYFAKDTVIVDREAGPFPSFHIIETGTVASRTAGLDTLPDRVLTAGECFPVGALSAGGQPTRSNRAVDDVFAYLLRIDDFRRLREISPEFEHFCTQAVTVLAQQSLAELQRHYSQMAADQHSLTRPLAEFVAREPVTCDAATTLRAALERMRDAAVRSIIVVDEAASPVGVFTLNDLRDRVVLRQLPLDTPIEAVMTRAPMTLPADSTALEAMQQMAAGGFHQMIVTDRGRVLGTVAEHDLFTLQRVSLRQIHHAIRSARTTASLAQVAGDIRNLANNLLAQGVSAEALTRTVSALNDALTREILTRITTDYDLTNIRWCWMALGSEGRGEQTLSTDQDNAIVYHVEPGLSAAEELRQRRDLLACAREANEALDTLGFPLCKGGIMASNPDCCLSEQNWRERFTQWLSQPTPEALLRANIFFDFRPLAGDSALTERLSEWLLARTADNKLFLRLMVANALQTEAPLGLIRAFAVDGEGPHAGTIDLKVRGTRVFVDAARVFALALGVAATGTAERLRLAGERMRVERRHVDATVEAFHYLQVLRLRSQGRGEHAGPNRIDPYALNDIDQRMLKEAFRQARKLQQRLKETFSMSL